VGVERALLAALGRAPTPQGDGVGVSDRARASVHGEKVYEPRINEARTFARDYATSNRN
jgi:hypothetical protein